MITAISILIFLACCLLVLAVLIQNPKGGGLASGFQSGSQVMGVRRTADFLEKATWSLAVLILVLSIVSTTMSGSANIETGEGESSATKEKTTDFDGGTPPAGGGALPLGGGTTPPPPTK
jgi:preprotein translocase subunit SecG